MMKIEKTNKLATKDVMEFQLENGDFVFMTVPQFDRFITGNFSEIDTSIIFEGIVHQYTVVLSEPEYSEKPAEIVGFVILY